MKKMKGLQYRQVDVFADRPLNGNGLAVFWQGAGLSAELMQALTRELRQFESIFLAPTDDNRTFAARVFTMEEELPFAGHPVLGAAAVLHEKYGKEGFETWTLELPKGLVDVETIRLPDCFQATMDQGCPDVRDPLASDDEERFLNALGLDAGDRDPTLPLQVLSTGLPYLLVPVTPTGLERASVRFHLRELLATVGARFVYVLDAAGREGRTWDDDGRVEDIATGSAAGPAGAFLCRHGRARFGERIVLRQGRFTGRDAKLEVVVESDGSVRVGGDVRMVAAGAFDVGRSTDSEASG